MKEFDLNIGAQVHCEDGKCGKLTKVAILPGTLRVTHLIAEEGFLLKHARAFPTTTVDYTGMKGIYLSVTSGELSNFPEYQEEEVRRFVDHQAGQTGPQTEEVWLSNQGAVYDPPVPMVREIVREGIPTDVVVVKEATPVKHATDTVGKLDRVFINAETQAITGLVISRGLVFTDQIMIPATWIEKVSEDAILITGDGDVSHWAEATETPEDMQERSLAESTMGGKIGTIK